MKQEVNTEQAEKELLMQTLKKSAKGRGKDGQRAQQKKEYQNAVDFYNKSLHFLSDLNTKLQDQQEIENNKKIINNVSEQRDFCLGQLNKENKESIQMVRQERIKQKWSHLACKCTVLIVLLAIFFKISTDWILS